MMRADMAAATDIDRLDVRLLRMLVLLLGERSVSRAAQKADMGQPAMSRVLGRLRTLFGDPLLIRGPGGMVCSERGSELAEGAREILAGLDRLVTHRSAFDAGQARRTFVVTAAHYSEHVLVPGIVRRMREQAPQARLEVRPPPYGHSFEGLERGEIDMHLAWGQGPAAASLRSVTLFTDRIVCVSDRPARARRRAMTADRYLSAAHVRVQASERTTTGTVVDRAVAQQGGALAIAMLVQGYNAIPAVIQATDLVATLPARLAKDLVAGTSLEIAPVPLRLPAVRVVGYWHERSQNDAGHRWFRNVVIAASQDLKA